jgi:hypothetical protein
MVISLYFVSKVVDYVISLCFVRKVLDYGDQSVFYLQGGRIW